MLIRVNDWLKVSGRRQKVLINPFGKESPFIIGITTTAGHHFCLTLYYGFTKKNNRDSAFHHPGLQYVEQTPGWSVRNGEPRRVSSFDPDFYLYDFVGRAKSDYILISLISRSISYSKSIRYNSSILPTV